MALRRGTGSWALTYGASTKMTVEKGSLDLPRKPGVYLFRNKDGRVMYVGKATEIRSRVASYFSGSDGRAMVPRLIEQADEVDFIVTKSPSEALTLERHLIKEHKPKFNSRLKDDKSYPYISLTKEEFPRIMYTRHPPEGSRSWGPFTNAGAAKRIIQLLREQFGIRDKSCKGEEGCLAMHINLCKGPCYDPEGYPNIVRAVTGVLDGNATVLTRSLQKEMDEASESLNYERAAYFRDMIASIQSSLSHQIIHSRFYQDCDAIGFSSLGDTGVVVILHAKEGVVQGKTEYPLIHRGDVSESVSLVLSEHYAHRRPPKILLLPTEIGEATQIWLKGRRGGAFEARVPLRGDLSKLRMMADRNAEILVVSAQKNSSGSLEQRAANDCAELLGISSMNHIVCFDMAQFMGSERVGASVVFRHGRPSKKEYRTYKIRGDWADDLRMMEESVIRWAKKQKEWPDLLLLDGGETHLSTIGRSLVENDLSGKFVLAALAKREETLFIEGEAPIILDRRGRVLIHSRDEAHRFVNQYHSKRRRKSSISDPLEEIDGLGAKKIQSLLRHFGGSRGIEHASVDELKAVDGIGTLMARKIREHYDR
ncbi:MAG: excinuclease ABC subunit UvrC [Candidatus Thermoplasmatota archaeon]|nr:excinuclease ABC subunit UvrC [Candidatus Thermoplasmatota archaeon]